MNDGQLVVLIGPVGVYILLCVCTAAAGLEETVSRKEDEIKSLEQRKKDVAARSR